MPSLTELLLSAIAVGASFAFDQIDRHRPGAAHAAGVGHLNRQDVAGRALEVEQRAVGHRDGAGLRVDGEGPAGVAGRDRVGQARNRGAERDPRRIRQQPRSTRTVVAPVPSRLTRRMRSLSSSVQYSLPRAVSTTSPLMPLLVETKVVTTPEPSRSARPIRPPALSAQYILLPATSSAMLTGLSMPVTRVCTARTVQVRALHLVGPVVRPVDLAVDQIEVEAGRRRQPVRRGQQVLHAGAVEVGALDLGGARVGPVQLAVGGVDLERDRGRQPGRHDGLQAAAVQVGAVDPVAAGVREVQLAAGIVDRDAGAGRSGR